VRSTQGVCNSDMFNIRQMWEEIIQYILYTTTTQSNNNICPNIGNIFQMGHPTSANDVAVFAVDGFACFGWFVNACHNACVSFFNLCALANFLTSTQYNTESSMYEHERQAMSLAFEDTSKD
jgi:hypothetical protein